VRPGYAGSHFLEYEVASDCHEERGQQQGIRINRYYPTLLFLDGSQCRHLIRCWLALYLRAELGKFSIVIPIHNPGDKANQRKPGANPEACASPRRHPG